MKNSFGYEEELSALREELARLKGVTNFKDAVACVFDNLKFAAANTGSREWDDQLEDLAEEVIEYAPEYKREWKDICKLSASLNAAEQRNTELVDLLKTTKAVLSSELSYELFHKMAEHMKRIDAALKPTESGASE